MWHRFEITQAFDEPMVLKALAIIFSVEVTPKPSHNSVYVDDLARLSYVIDYFFKTMKGRKSLEYRIWARSFNKRKRGYEYLLKIQEKIRNLKTWRPENFVNRKKKSVRKRRYSPTQYESTGY